MPYAGHWDFWENSGGIVLMSRLVVLVAAFSPVGLVKAADVPAVDFDRQVAPLLAQHCLDCHSGPKPKGRLDLTRRRTALTGGRSGAVVLPGKPDDSLLCRYVEAGRMPPKRPLPEADRALLRAWVAAGAPWGSDPIDPFRITTTRRAGYDWWALQPVHRPTPPAVRDPGWVRNPIDAFVLHRLEAHGLHPAAEADRRTLIRRLSFDLLGLPPDPEDVAAFVRDDSPDAYKRLVERYLASPQYGVRWARHWLDVVRFGESNGFEFDEFRPNAWPYRDWVVDALNRDLPYDEFARLQLAGDVLRPDDPDAVRATGFLVAGAYDTVGQTQQSAAMRRVVRQDELEDLVSTVGQTFLGLTIHCARCHDHKFDPVRQADYYRLTAALGGIHHGERTLAGRKVYAVVPSQPEVAHVLARGNPQLPGAVVAAGGVAALPGADFGLPPDAPEAERRRRLAHWVTDPGNPLFARVLVNRLWHYHFGTGLVETPNDFGFNGGRPSHPELIDWLASELVARRWSLKEMHRVIVLSATYRQAGTWDAASARVDAGSRLLWRRAPLRLEAEEVRDAMLRIAGLLSLQVGGPSVQDFVVSKAPGTAANLYTPAGPAGDEPRRRTLYRAWARGGHSRLLDTLDCPDPAATAPSRAVTTTPLQALALLNNALVLRLSADFAERVRREAGPDVDAQVRRVYLLAFGRLPDGDELARARGVVRRHGLAVLARAVFNSSEFLYVD
jgi:hypothetical protein